MSLRDTLEAQYALVSLINAAPRGVRLRYLQALVQLNDSFVPVWHTNRSGAKPMALADAARLGWLLQKAEQCEHWAVVPLPEDFVHVPFDVTAVAKGVTTHD